MAFRISTQFHSLYRFSLDTWKILVEEWDAPPNTAKRHGRDPGASRSRGGCERKQMAMGSFTSQDLFLRCFARIRRLRKSPQYVLVILQWKMTVSAKLPQNLRRRITKSWLAKFPRWRGHVLRRDRQRRAEIGRIRRGGSQGALLTRHPSGAMPAPPARSRRLFVGVPGEVPDRETPI